MSDFTPEQERDLLAAEFALRVLEADELAQAESLILSDPAFRAQVEAWQVRLGPLGGGARAQEPDPAVWRRIEAAIEKNSGSGNVVALKRKLGVWRAGAAAATAIAASLALVIAYQGSRDAAPPSAGRTMPVLVASLSSEDADTSLSVAYDQATGSLLITPTQLPRALAHDHELWIVPEGGKPISLGVIRGERPSRHSISAQIAPHFRQRSSIALSVEPRGGSPTGQPTGPVVAAGELIII